MPINIHHSEVEWCPTNLKKDKKTDNENQLKQLFIRQGEPELTFISKRFSRDNIQLGFEA